MAQEAKKEETSAGVEERVKEAAAKAGLDSVSAMLSCFELIDDLRYGSGKNNEKKEKDGIADKLDADKIIESLVKKGELPERSVVRKVLIDAKDVFLSQGPLIELNSNSDTDCEDITYVGPISGYLSTLIKLFEKHGSPSEKKTYVFLGRYVNRGDKSLECLLLLLAYKIKYPQNVILLRGNHEALAIATVYGLYSQCKEKKYATGDFIEICDCFDCMPFVCIVDKKYFCVSGGISDKLNDLKDIKDIKLPVNIPNTGLVTDLLWSDPSGEIEDWGVSPRGAGQIFGEKAALSFCKKFGFDLIIRGLELTQNGYEEFGKEKKVVTLFSAENYMGTYDNKGGFMTIDKEGKRKFHHV